MNQMFKTRSFGGLSLFLALFFVNATAQNRSTAPSIRTKENFDFRWQFHKGDIAIKRAVKAAGYGGLTDVNVKVETNKDAIVAYTDVAKAATDRKSVV